MQQLYTSLLQSKVNAKTKINTFGLLLEPFYFEEELHDTYTRICVINLCCFVVWLVVLFVWFGRLCCLFVLLVVLFFGLVGCAVFRFGRLCCFFGLVGCAVFGCSILLAIARKQTTSKEILLWMTPSEAPKALQASECSELLDPMRASCWISAQH